MEKEEHAQYKYVRGSDGKLRILGQGAFGKVLLAQRERGGSKKLVAIKQLNYGQMAEEDRKSAREEVTRLRNFRHPFIIRYIDSYLKSDSLLCIVMEYANAGDLDIFLKSSRSYHSIDVIMDIFCQSLLPIAFLHKKRLIHRDIKARNLFLRKSAGFPSGFQVLLGDFGISKLLKYTLQNAHTQVGTPYYLAPEICLGKRYNHKADMWSLGCVLYELATLNHPFPGKGALEVANKIISNRRRPLPGSFRDTIVEELVDQLLQIAPNLRPSAVALMRIPEIAKRIDAVGYSAMAQEYIEEDDKRHGRSRTPASWHQTPAWIPPKAVISGMKVDPMKRAAPHGDIQPRRSRSRSPTPSPPPSRSRSPSPRRSVPSPPPSRSPSPQRSLSPPELVNELDRPLRGEKSRSPSPMPPQTPQAPVLPLESKRPSIEEQFNTTFKAITGESTTESEEEDAVLATEQPDAEHEGVDGALFSVHSGETEVQVRLKKLWQLRRTDKFLHNSAPVDLPNIEDADPLAHRIEGLRRHLEDCMGEEPLRTVYLAVQQAMVKDVEGKIAARIVKALGGEGAAFVPLVYQLVHCENRAFGKS